MINSINTFLYHCISYISVKDSYVSSEKQKNFKSHFYLSPLHHDKGAIGICTLEINLKINCLMRACKSKTNKSERATDEGAGYWTDSQKQSALTAI